MESGESHRNDRGLLSSRWDWIAFAIKQAMNRLPVFGSSLTGLFSHSLLLKRKPLHLPVIFFAFAIISPSRAQDAPWLVRDAPYRAVITLKQPPKVAECGVLIDLPEFGHTRADLADVLLVGAKGEAQPLAAVWRGEGRRALMLAKELKPGENYSVYFGGNAIRAMQSWTPKISLLLETRRMPDNAKFDSWPDMQKTWQSASKVDGMGFVPVIFQPGNPFGENAHFVTHFTGWLQRGGLGKMLLFTLSSDASFVLVNGKFELGWPGVHPPWANLKNVHTKEVACAPGIVKIDYYHAKAGDDGVAGTVLGWQQDGKYQTIPAEAWLHPGISQIQKIEETHGGPVPTVNVKPDSYLGYGGEWFVETNFSLTGANPDGWNVEWQFEDGAIFSGAQCRRVVVGSRPQIVTVKLKRGGDEVRGVKRFDLPDNLSAASVNNTGDVARYLELLAKETPAQLSKETLEADLTLLRDFADDGQISKFAGAWLQKNPDPQNPLWLAAQSARARALARTDPAKALDELRKIDPAARKNFSQPLDLLELDLLVFYLRDATVVERAKRMAFQYPDTDAERLAKIRAGDFYRLTERYKPAVEQYQSVQKTIADESAGRKLPAQDQAYSMTIENLLGRNLRREAAEKLREWELRHPMAKFDSDFLLLQARMLNAFGRWNESLAELDSFKKIQRDSPYAIDADFYRAQALSGLGKKEEARKIWNEIATKYPKHELATMSRELAKKP